MATTQRSEYVDTATKDLRLNPAIDSIPAHLAPDIQLTYELKAPMSVISQTLTNATQSFFLVTGDRDVYISSISLDCVKDVTATTTSISVRAFVDGVQRRLLTINTTTLTVERAGTSISYPIPIKIDRNTSITMDSLTNVANFQAAACMTFYVMSK
jgi:hypothetical protein